MEIIITGGSNNNYCSIGCSAYLRSIKIDDWKQLSIFLKI